MRNTDSSFRAIHDDHADFVRVTLKRYGVHDADLLDVVQKVFLTAYLKLPEFEGRAAISTWLFAICRRFASDYRRSAKVRRELTYNSVELFQTDELAKDVEETFEAERRVDAAKALLARLPENQRLAFLLHQIDGMPAGDIAALFGLPVGTVRSRLRLARRSLKRAVIRQNRDVTQPS